MFCFIIWLYRFNYINRRAFKQEQIIYNMGEFVELEGDFFFSSKENTNGYSIKVNSAEVKEYSEVLHDYGMVIQNRDGFTLSKYVFLINITIKNNGNNDGVLSTMGFSLCNGSLYMPVDYELWNIIDEKINGNINLKLKENTEVTLTIPFTPQMLDEAVAPRKLYDKLFNESFYFYVSDFPKQKLIEVYT